MRFVLHILAALSAMVAGASVVQPIMWLAGNDHIDISATVTRLVVTMFIAVLFEVFVELLTVLDAIYDRLQTPKSRP